MRLGRPTSPFWTNCLPGLMAEVSLHLSILIAPSSWKIGIFLSHVPPWELSLGLGLIIRLCSFLLTLSYLHLTCSDSRAFGFVTRLLVEVVSNSWNSSVPGADPVTHFSSKIKSTQSALRSWSAGLSTAIQDQANQCLRWILSGWTERKMTGL